MFSVAILGALGGHLGAALGVSGAILGIFELMLEEVGPRNRKSGLRIVIYEVFVVPRVSQGAHRAERASLLC